jgi:hypothetical protein
LKKQNLNFKTYIEPTSLKKNFFIVIRNNLHNYIFSPQEKKPFYGCIWSPQSGKNGHTVGKCDQFGGDHHRPQK